MKPILFVASAALCGTALAALTIACDGKYSLPSDQIRYIKDHDVVETRSTEGYLVYVPHCPVSESVR